MGLIATMKGNYKPFEHTIGDGHIGLKTRSLRRDKDFIESSGFVYPSNVALTGAFFQNFLTRCGAHTEEKLSDVQERIKKTPFNEEEKKWILNAVMQFPPEMRYRLMVRSDEYDGGTGINHSGVVLIEKEDLQFLLRIVEIEIKRVLMSYFTSDSKIFAEKMGLDKNLGVLLMPIFGEDLSALIGKTGIMPPISINYLGEFNGSSISTTGVGIGLKNTESEYGVPLFDFLINCTLVIPNIECIAAYPRNIFSWKRAEEERRWSENGTCSLDGIGRADILEKLYATRGKVSFTKIYDLIAALVESGSRYLEIVLDGLAPDCDYVVVQSAPKSLRQIEKPLLGPDSKVLIPNYIIGTKVVKTNKLKVADCCFNSISSASLIFDEVLPALEKYNTENTGHALIITTDNQQFISSYLQLKHYSNAGAIIIVYTNTRASLISYLDGIFRTLDIPVLSIQKGRFPELLNMQKGLENGKMQCTIYANEFPDERPHPRPEGFIAFEEIK